MSSTPPSGSPVDPHAAVGQTPAFPFIKHLPTVHEKLFGELHNITARVNAACNALIFDEKLLPPFIRNNTQWNVLCYYRGASETPVIYLHWDHNNFRSDANWKAYREYRDYLQKNVIQFEETVTALGDFELRIDREHFRIDVQSPVPRQPNFTPPDVQSTTPVPPQ